MEDAHGISTIGLMGPLSESQLNGVVARVTLAKHES